MASEIVALVGVFTSIIVLIIMYFRTRHIERMALIENDKTAQVFDTRSTDANTALKFGLLLLSIGLGLLIGLIFDNMLDTEPAGVFVSILTLGGLSLIIYHVYISAKNKSEKNQNQDLV